MAGSSSNSDLSSLRVLVSNDDGIGAAGIKRLEALMRKVTEDVWVCAPDSERSACGHSVTLHHPVRLKALDERHFTTDGTPTDCVFIGVHHVLADRKPDLVVSGINVGLNLGTHVSYSGTVAAAKEATVLGIPAIAFSQQVRDWDRGPDWRTAERFLPDVLSRIVRHGIAPGTLFNVNFPDVEPDAVSGIEIVRLGAYDFIPDLQRRTDPRGRDYFWIGADLGAGIPPGDTDMSVIEGGGISITPLSLDFTHYASFDSLKSAFA